jgi:hypothetical protein
MSTVYSSTRLPERSVERKLTEGVKRVGGLCWKWVSPGRAGVPDRIVVVDACVWFVEVKAQGSKERPLQKSVRQMIERAGGQCRVVVGVEGVKDFLDEIARIPKSGG